MNSDLRIRLATFDWLAEQTEVHGDVLTRDLLQQGFEFQGKQIPLVSPQGIFKPRIMELPLTITSSPSSPYDDTFSSSGYLTYRYRGKDPGHRDNVGLRRVFELNRPLVYFFGIVPSRYLAVWPVYIIADHPERLSFELAVDDLATVDLEAPELHRVREGEQARRAYVTATVRTRLHQRSFRERVIEAYRSQCAFCRLRYRELLDAAHIIPDPEEAGDPIVSNGLALCKLHHAAFDSFMLGVTPDYRIRVRKDLLAEEDGPMLIHALQGLHEQLIQLPQRRDDWPNPDSLAWRYARFAEAPRSPSDPLPD
ncbi:MAG: HNH endonuclease [Rhodothermia bacterium]